MIGTVEKILIDSEARLIDFLFMQVGDMRTNRKDGLVSFEIEQFLIKDFEVEEIINTPKKRTDYTEEGEPFEVGYIEQSKGVVIYPKLVSRKKREAILKEATFYKRFGSITPEDYDSVLINQIDWINSYEPSGNEIQSELFYWNLKATDLKIITAEDLKELLKPRIKK